MFTEGVREIFLEGAEEHGWFADRDKKLLDEGANRLLELIKSGVDPDEAMRLITANKILTADHSAVLNDSD